ncbi:MAG: T9SS type A sorting domain-containing protein [Syntrophothermus sp.]
MKIFHTFLIAIFLNITNYSQTTIFPDVELNIRVLSNDNLKKIEFILEPITLSYDDYYYNAVYEANGFCNFEIMDISLVYNKYPAIIELNGNSSDSHVGYTVGSFSGVYNFVKEFRQSIYKISVKVNGIQKCYFYFDNRHSQFPHNSCSLPGFITNDIIVNYNVALDSLTYKSNQDQNPPKGLIKGTTINWWEICTTHGTINHDGFYPKSFASLNFPQKITYNPFLSWSASENFGNVNRYELQRSIYPYGFSTIYTTTSNLSYKDTDILWHDNEAYNTRLVQYRVLTFYYEPEYTCEVSNVVHIKSHPDLMKYNNYKLGNYTLYQNYPNPFNPSTNICYQIPEDGYITIKLFNLIGEEIKTILSDYKKSGIYNIELNADNLSSGVYIYKLYSKDVILSHKMILLR